MQALRRYRAPVSAERLAAELDVSVRSIYRDIVTLRGQGATIAGEAGMGYVLSPGFALPPMMFSDLELESIVLGLRLCAQHADEELVNAARDVAGKLRAVLPKDSRTLFDEVSLLAGPPLQRPPEVIDAAEVRRALRASKKARISYQKEGEAPSVRIIWPLGLAFFERSRVVVAWCESRDGFRSFRMDRIRAWHTLEEGIGGARMRLLRQWRELERAHDSMVADKN